MNQVFSCDQCGKDIETKFLEVGERAQCKSCGAPNTVPAPGQAKRTPIPMGMTTTTFGLDGFHTKTNLGVVLGLTVRSRSVVGSFGASIQQLVGGEITLYTELCQKTRDEAFRLMIANAQGLGANAIVGIRYDANEVSDGATEVLCYGTALVVEPN